MGEYFAINRDGGIPLEEWVDLISRSAVIRPVLPREGVNPFTKAATVFHPPSGAATFDTTGGSHSIEYKAGTLLVKAGDAAAIEVVKQIAGALRATAAPVEA